MNALFKQEGKDIGRTKIMLKKLQSSITEHKGAPKLEGVWGKSLATPQRVKYGGDGIMLWVCSH